MGFGALRGAKRRGADTSREASKGAAMVEMALVAPILILILVGIFEIGIAFYDYLTVSYVTRDGARVGSFMGDDAQADCEIIKTVAAGLTGAQFQRMNELQVFKADSQGRQGATNTYRFTGTNPQNCGHWSSTIGWSPTSRQTLVGTRPLDILGVRILMRHDWITGFPPFRGFFTINEDSITRLEPEAYE